MPHEPHSPDHPGLGSTDPRETELAPEEEPVTTGTLFLTMIILMISGWTDTVGVLIFARGMISAGLEGMPRRTFMAAATYDNPAWRLGGTLTGIGGTLMSIGVMLFFLVIGMTIVAGRRGEQPRDIPVSEILVAPAARGWEPTLDRLGLWAVAALALIAIAYGPFFLTYDPQAVSPGFKLF